MLPDITERSWCTAAYPYRAPDAPQDDFQERRPLSSCAGCGQPIYSYAGVAWGREDEMYCCKDCMDDHYFVALCSDCGQVLTASTVYVAGGEPVCQHCCKAREAGHDDAA